VNTTLVSPTVRDLTGLVLAGGQASRMGGVDKGQQMLAGKALALHVVERLRPQVEQLLISANRNLDLYRAYGHPVVTDAGHHPGAAADSSGPNTTTASGAGLKFENLGPLAGILAGMRAAGTSHVLCVPCDVPYLPASLATALLAALRPGQTIAYAITGAPHGQARRHPACALLACSLADDLAAYLAGGGRKVGAWYARHNAAEAVFPDERAFYNVNSRQDLDHLAGAADSPPDLGLP
jgi:molybdopterin-guanine dinucleotide biosynthesis protein A